MPINMTDFPTYMDTIRLWVETTEDSSIADPLEILSLELLDNNRKLYIFEGTLWNPHGGLLTRDSEGRFYIDICPYAKGLRSSGHYTLAWSYRTERGLRQSSVVFSLDDWQGPVPPRELTDEIAIGDLIRLRFLLLDKYGSPVDPEIIDRLVVYQIPLGANKEGIETSVVFSLSKSKEGIWTKSGSLADDNSSIVRESKGSFYFDWNSASVVASPGRCIVMVSYRFPPEVSLIRGDSWEYISLEFFLTPSYRSGSISQERFLAMYQQWIPSMMWAQEPVGDLAPVSSRLLEAFGEGNREWFNWSESLKYIYDAQKVEAQALPSLASNLGWTIRGRDQQGWRTQIERAVNLFSSKGTLEGLRGFIEVSGGSLENVTRYWQVAPRYTWTDYFVVDDLILSNYTLKIEQPGVLYRDLGDPYRFFRLKVRTSLSPMDASESSIRVVRGSRRVQGNNTFFLAWLEKRKSWLESHGLLRPGQILSLKIMISVGEHEPVWMEVRKIETDDSLELIDRYTGESASSANFTLVESEYHELPVENYLDIESTESSIDRIRWKADADIDLLRGDEILLQYQTRTMDSTAEELELEILSLTLVDSRDERLIRKSKNFNAYLLEDPEGIWYKTEPNLQLRELEKVDQFYDGVAPLSQAPLSLVDIIPTDTILEYASPFSTCPLPDISGLSGFASSLGYLFVEGDVCPFFFILQGAGGSVGSGAWISRVGSGILAIEVTSEGLRFRGANGGVTEVWITYNSIAGMYSTLDRTFLRSRRDRLCPLGTVGTDPVVFGYERTAFPYSEKVYNMDEYNGSLRPSYNPCAIDDLFKDECDCSPTPWFDLTIRTRDLSNNSIKEFEQIVREAKPFHGQVRKISFVGDMRDQLIFTEQLECLIIMRTSEQMLWVREEMGRDNRYHRLRGSYVLFNSVLKGSGNLVNPQLTFYSPSSDFTVSSPVNDPHGLLIVEAGDIGEYSIRQPTLRELTITGGTNTDPTPYAPQRFSIYNPIGFSAAWIQEESHLYGLSILGLNAYSALLVGARSEGLLEGTLIQVPGVDVQAMFNIHVGDFIQVPGDNKFYQIQEIRADENNIYSIMLIREELIQVNMISFWKRPIHNGVGEFQRSYNSVSVTASLDWDPDARYVISMSEPKEKSGEITLGPISSGMRKSLANSPIVVDDLFEFSGSERPAWVSLSGNFSCYGAFERGAQHVDFVVKGSGGDIGVGADVDPPQPDISSIYLTENGIEFNYTGVEIDNLRIWYYWRESGFHPVESFKDDPDHPGRYIVQVRGINALDPANVDFEIYEIIPTGIMYNPRRYSGSLLPPYSCYGSFNKNNQTYYFVLKEEGGAIGKKSGVSPQGSGLEAVYLTGSSVSFEPEAGVELNAFELAPLRSREEGSREKLLMRIVPDFPYFISVDERNQIDNSYFRNPSVSGIDRNELGFMEEVVVEINDGGRIRRRQIYKGD